MKKFFLFLLFIVCLGNAYAQKWAPIGARWTYSFMEGLGTFIRSYPVLWETKDTVRIQGKLCSITCPKSSSGVWLTDSSDMFRTMITYEDSGKVYWYVPDSAFFTVLYDFTKNVGDSWEIKGMHTRFALNSCPLKVTVMSVGLDTINGIPLKSMVIKDPTGMPVFGGKIIQGIGHIDLPRPIPARICATPSDVEDYFGLRCIDIPGIGFHDFKREPTCDFVRTSVMELSKNYQYRIVPNPSSGDITISVASMSMKLIQTKVYDLMGRIVYQSPIQFVNNSASLNLDVANGTYLLELQDEGGNVQRERIVIN